MQEHKFQPVNYNRIGFNTCYDKL